jgi:hypothetical protein
MKCTVQEAKSPVKKSQQAVLQGGICNGPGTGFLTQLVAVVEQKVFGGYCLI